MKQTPREALEWRKCPAFIEVCARLLYVQRKASGGYTLCLHEGSYPDLYMLWMREELE